MEGVCEVAELGAVILKVVVPTPQPDQRMLLCDMIDRCEGLLICYDYVVRPQQISYILDKRPCGFLNFHVVALCMPEPE